MRIPRGKSYKVFKTREKSLEAILNELKKEAFSGYLRLTAEVDGELIDAYIVFEKGNVIAASYEGKEKIYGDEAFRKIPKLFSSPGICDVHSLSEFQLEITKEENPECLIKTLLKERQIAEKEAKAPEVREEVAEEIERAEKPEKIDEASREMPEVESKDIKKRRMELLKKYGLREPDDSFVESIVKTFYMPADYEIAAKAKELKREIIKKIKSMKNIENADVYISTAKGHDIVEFSVDVYIKPLTEKTKSEIESIIESILSEKVDFPFQKEITVIEA